jgi:hypothetical protein
MSAVIQWHTHVARESIVTVTLKSFRITNVARFADTIFDSYDVWREFQEHRAELSKKEILVPTLERNCAAIFFVQVRGELG